MTANPTTEAEASGWNAVMHGRAGVQYAALLSEGRHRRTWVDWPSCPYRRPDRRAAWHRGVDAACEAIRDSFNDEET